MCRIFGHMAHYCRNKEEKKGPVWVLKNIFEALKDRMMERGEGSSREIVKDRKEIEEREREDDEGREEREKDKGSKEGPRKEKREECR